MWRVEKSVIPVNNISELKKIFGWQKSPVFDDPSLHHFEVIEDVNERRIRDAEVLGTVCCNVNSRNFLEIGTATGHATALMSINAPQATVYTLNILPEELLRGEGGGYNTYALEKEKIGSYYREKNLKNIVQIYANTSTWKPDLKEVGVAFIDGCHDTKYVINDTLKALKCMSSGSFILWHDFHPALTRKYEWIYEVCLGVEKLLSKKIIKGRIFHVKDSWVGLYQIP
ncbi:MAG: class I SAM-dependent methyltransferase [Oligoflexia bacterium]|nr:class I SAM-dependent methyltransferase [Oligoflexia bacterium]